MEAKGEMHSDHQGFWNARTQRTQTGSGGSSDLVTLDEERPLEPDMVTPDRRIQFQRFALNQIPI